MVATPHWGACFLSIDLTSDEIFATGDRQRFVLRQMTHWVTASLTPHWAARLLRLFAQGCRPFFAEKEPLALSPGAPNPSSDEISATPLYVNCYPNQRFGQFIMAVIGSSPQIEDLDACSSPMRMSRATERPMMYSNAWNHCFFDLIAMWYVRLSRVSYKGINVFTHYF